MRGAGQRNGPAVPVASLASDVRELDREMGVREWGIRLVGVPGGSRQWNVQIKCPGEPPRSRSPDLCNSFRREG